MTNKKSELVGYGNEVLCILCEKEEAGSREHILKKSLLKDEMKSLEPGESIQIIGLAEREGLKKLQGLNAELVKYGRTVCTDCNNKKSQPYDLAYDRIFNDESKPVMKLNEFMESCGLPVIPAIKDLSSKDEQWLYRTIFRFDLLGIYHYLKLGVCIYADNGVPPSVAVFFTEVIKRNLRLQRTTPALTKPGIIDSIEPSDKPLVVAYCAKQVACTLHERGKSVPKGIRDIFLDNQSVQYVGNVFVFDKWLDHSKFSTSYIADSFYSSLTKRYVHFFFQELKQRSVFAYFEAEKLMDEDRKTFLTFADTI